jgi:hypothetical protein
MNLESNSHFSSSVVASLAFLPSIQRKGLINLPKHHRYARRDGHVMTLGH